MHYLYFLKNSKVFFWSEILSNGCVTSERTIIINKVPSELEAPIKLYVLENIAKIGIIHLSFTSKKF